MGRVVELVVLVNALGGLSAFGLRYWHRRFRSPRQHITELERENAEMDAALLRMRGGK